MSSNASRKRAAGATVPTHLKYPKYDAVGAAQLVEDRKKPSQMMLELQDGPVKPAKFAPPQIIEFQNLEDNSANVNSVVDVDEPIFQPFPMQLCFDEYEPFGTYEKILHMRNNDNVPRRIKIIPPDSEFFEISAPRAAQKGAPLKNGKVAAGMEVCFAVKFKPQEKRNYELDLVCCTEREKFVVPIRSLGTMAALNFPDDIDFGVCPVQALTTKTLVVRNLGTKASKFLLTTTEPFHAATSDIYTDVGGSCQIKIEFFPRLAGEYGGDLSIVDEDGRQSYVNLTGLCDNVNVFLEKPSIEPDPAYISLSSQKTVKIFNRSEFPVKFDWKAFATVAEEVDERARLRDELERMQSLERASIEEQVFDEDSDASLSDDEGTPSAKRMELAALKRKYKNLRKAVQEDKMHFADENFQLEPISGEIWANSEIEVTVTFRPQTAAEYDCAAFLDVTGRDSRLSLQLSGKGIGPKATLSYDVLDIGDVFVNSVHKYEIMLQNRGDIESRYELQPSNTPFGPKFLFEPSSGLLEVGQSHKLEVTFCSEILGEFSEHFNFKLQGSDEPLSVHFKGHVVGPTFHFDVEEIDFGIVSYEFLHSKTISLINTSEIPMKFHVRVPQDGNFLDKEFQLIPPHGTVLPMGKQQITVDFISTNVKKYDYYLTVDVEGVGEGLLSLPISAECKVPDVKLVEEDVQYGDCFMRYPYQRTLVLSNESDLQAKYEVIAQDEHSQAVATYEADAFKGAIPPWGKHNINVTMVCEKLGNIRLPLYVQIAGSSGQPLMATVSATGKGPNVQLSKDKLDFGPISCLIDHHRKLTLKNDSLIPAPFKAFIKSSRSKFYVWPKEGVLAPGESTDLKLSANLDDTVPHKDLLHIIVTEGHNLAVPLTARGTGTTMYCDDDLTRIDFGYQLTNKVCDWKTTLENKGRRTQVISWVNLTLLERFQEAKRKEKEAEKSKKKNQKKAAAIVVEPTFTVTPESIELRPRTACTFTFRGMWKKPESVTEILVCETKVGQEKNAREALRTQIHADFINPLLEPSMPRMSFNYTYSPDVELVTQTQPLTLRNVSELPLTFVMRTQSPFTIDSWECSLAPQENTTVNVSFDPGYKDDRQSHVVNGKLLCVYRDHPQKDAIELIGEMNFPNLEFEYQKIDFGCILNDTTKSVVMKVTNCCKVHTAFQWAFCEDEIEARSLATAKKPYIPVNQVFDILPIRAYLAPGETEEVEFVYYAHANRKFKGQVLCEVEGGPEYELALVGDASSVSHKLDKQNLDFGQMLYNKSEERDFCIINTGKVSFPFNIRLDKVSRAGVVEVHPMSGRVFANDKQRIVVRFRPGIPRALLEHIIVEVGHFAPVEFPLSGVGIYASLAVTLPRLPLPVNAPWSDPEPMPMPFNFDHLLEDARVAALEADPYEFAADGKAESRPTSRLQTIGQSSANLPSAAMQLTGASGRANTPGMPMGAPSTAQSKAGRNRPTSPTTTVATGYTGYHVSESMVHLEKLADRIYFERYLREMEHVARLEAQAAAESEMLPPPPVAAQAPQPPDLPLLELPGDAADAVGTKRKAPAGKARGNKKAANDRGFVLSCHICDFSNIVSGQVKTKKFKITNTGHLPISFSIDKKLASAAGFTIEPERVVRLPEDESVEFVVVFTADKEIPLGPVDCELFLDQKNGPTVMVLLHANVTVPDVKITTQDGEDIDRGQIDFGRLLVGRSQVTYAQLWNPTPVVSEWAFKKPLGSARDLGNFTMTPDCGALQPNERVNIAVEFIPLQGRNHIIRVPIKVNNNNKTTILVLKGEGTEMGLQFFPDVADFGPILPYEVGNSQQQKIVTMKNNSDYPIEVYSLDFDEQFYAEEDVMMEASGYDESDIMRVKIRAPGEGLPEHVLEETAQRKDREERARKAAELAAEQGEDGEPVDVNMQEDELPELQVEEREPTARDQGSAHDYVVYGPKLSGKSTQASMLVEERQNAKGHNVALIAFDDVIEAALGCEGSHHGDEERPADLGFRVRDALNKLSPEEAADKKLREAAAEEARPKSGGKGKKGKPPPTPSPRPEDQPPAFVSAELLSDILRWRLQSPDCGHGAVVDDLFSVYTESPEIGAIACAAALGEGQINKAELLLLSASDDAYADMLARIDDTATDRVKSMGDIEADDVAPDADASEEAFVEASEEELSGYDDAAFAEYDSKKQAADEKLAARAEREAVQAERAAAIALTDRVATVRAEINEAAAQATAAQEAVAAEPQDADEEPSAQEGPDRTRTVYDRTLEAVRDAFSVEPEVQDVAMDGADGAPEIETINAETQAVEAVEDMAVTIADDPDAGMLTEEAQEGQEVEPSTPDSLVVEVPVEVGDDQFSVHEAMVTLMPIEDEDNEEPILEIPPPVVNMLIRRPMPRAQRSSVAQFAILEEVADEPEPEPEPEVPVDPKAKGKAAVVVEEVEVEQAPLAPKTKRWILEPHATVDINVRFNSTETGVYDSSLGFEIVGGSREYNLLCHAVCAVPTISDDPRNVFMSRIKGRPSHILVSKKFVMNTNVYEFGPLLIGKDAQVRLTSADVEAIKAETGSEEGPALPAKDEHEAAKQRNSETFRITNTGRTEATIDFCFESNADQIFYVHPSTLVIDPSDTGQVQVWAFPTESKLYSDSLVCCIQDNPHVQQFNLTCLGSNPSIQLHGPWEEAAAEAMEAANAMEEGVEKTSALDAANALLSVDPIIDFDRLLLRRSEDRELTLVNTSDIPIAWRINLNDLAGLEEYDISPMEGELVPGQEAKVTVGFSAIKEQEFDQVMNIEFADIEGGMANPERLQTIPVQVKAEAYSIDICSFEQEDGTPNDGHIDFGTVQVGQAVTQSFVITNKGKYDIKYCFVIRKAYARELFTITPMEAVIAPTEQSTVEVTFNCNQCKDLVNNKEIRCLIMEARTGEEYDSFVVSTSVHSVFSEFVLHPQRGINFGAIKYNEEVKSRKLEIKNDGEFDFQFVISGEDEDLPVLPQPGEVVPDTQFPAKSFSQFTVTPSGGKISPGTSATLMVDFQPKGAQIYREILKINLSCRDMMDAAASNLLEYEVVGESCFPGINIDNFEDIFEEQAVVPYLEPGENQRTALFLQQDNKFDFGYIVPSSHPKGVPEKFKISNPNKVPCNVKFEINSTEGGAASDTVFTVVPEAHLIPAHEHRYVTVYFKPSAMKDHTASFVATVEDGPEEGTQNQLEFAMSGKGTMPCVTIEQPLARNATGAIMMDFDRLQMGKRKEIPLIVRNDGVVRATVLFSMDNNSSFSFAGRGTSLPLEPKESKTIMAMFHPAAPMEEPTTCELQITVQHNQFEATTVLMSGLGFHEDLTFENLPGEKADELAFSDLELGAEEQIVQAAFSLKSHTDSPMRFSWAEHGAVTFSPPIGHLQPRSTKKIIATFRSDATIELVNELIGLTFQHIKYTSDDAPDWEQKVTSVTYGDDSDAKSADKSSTSAEPDLGQDDAEPEHELVDEPKTVDLKVSAVADKLQYECETKAISFKPTYMFQTRTLVFPVKNTSKAQMPYNWAMEPMSDSRPSTAKSMQTLPNPYSISPRRGVIAAGEEVQFEVRYTPLEVDEFRYRLSCQIPGTEEDPLTISLNSRAIRPVCHFDLQSTDYAAHRSPEMVGPTGELGALDPSVHVVEMESLGTRVRNTKRFYVINPLNTSYEFSWEPEGVPNAAFRCISQSGLLLPGKRGEMIFEYTPDNVGITEAFYRFRVPSHGVDELFLFVGSVLEPKVQFNVNRIDFGALLLGGSATENLTIINSEHIPFAYNFDKTTFAFGARPQITLNPVSGVVPPNGKANVEITFAPSEEKSHNFNLVCNVRRKPTKLSLNVKGEGYAIHDRMDLEEDMTESGGGVIFTEITRGSGDMNYVDFGTTHINEKVVRKVVITNSGKFNFDFSWARSKNPMLMVSPEAGTVKKGEKLVCTMLFNPVKEVSLDQFSMECTVAGSRVYKMSVVARAIRYALNFSWMKHNFGPTFVAAPGAPPQSEECMLTIVNQELDEDVSLDCLWEKNSFLDVQCPPTVMPPDSTLQIPIVFTAREHKKYSGKIPFLVNGTSTIFVDVEGEGCGVKIELASPAHQAVNFGSLQVGQEVSRQVKLVNRSKRSATFELIDPIVAGRGQLDQYAVSFFPVGETTLGPRESCVVDLQFRPLQRVAKFTEELQILVAGSTRKLLTVTGACTGMEVHLETETLPFGSVCEKSNLTRHLQMENTGDMVTKYQWDAKAFGPDFSISPAEGLLAPFSQIKFEITFHPRRIDDDIRYEGLACYLEGANPVHVTLTGACIAQPDSDVKELQFETKARTTQSQSVTVANPSDKDWCLLPVLQGENWTQSSETLDIPAKKSADFEVIYQPLSMTGGADGTDVPHNGTLFFALPDGTALLYNLSGIASDPEAEEQLSFETRAKQSLPIKLPVKNWLKTSQRFSVDIKLDEDSQTGSVFLNGGKTVDVPALQARDYNLKFYSFKEGTYNATVTFTNPKTGEYIAHSLVFTATAPGTAETIALEAPVRATASKIVTISNPLDASQPVTFPADDSWWKCDNPNVRVKQLGNMSGASEGNFEIRYRPLLPSEETCMLVLSCPELGDYNYELKLKATAAGTERALNFKSSLGATQEQVFKFRSFVPEGCTYACSVSNKDFFRVAMETVQAPPSADWEGQEVSVKVFFEPNQMGDVKDILKISSPTGGDFACILQGQCTQPLPRGPFTLKKGESQDISFKNVFSDAREFTFTVDNAEFAVATDKSSIAAKAEFNVKVTFKGENAKPAGVSGKLLVSCGTELPPWVFYLKGDMSA